jgi:integrase
MASIRKLKTGNYQVQIRLQGLPPVTRSFKTKSKARDFARKIEGNTELARKLGKAAKNIPTFQELADLYMKQYIGRDPSTLGRIKWWCNRFGDKPVSKVDEHMVDDGLIVLSKKRTGSTCNRYKSSLSAVFIYFIRHPDYKKLKLANPVRRESVSRFSENPSKDRFLSKDEQKSLLAACQSATWDKLYILILAALTTGGRKGELLGLRWSDIDFQNRTARLGMTKNGKPRLLPLTKPVIEELTRFREVGKGLVFHNTISKSTPYDIKKQWLKALEVSGIGHCRFHDLRHSAASNLVQAGRTLFEVGTLLGHSSTSMTARYSHLAVHDTLDMVDAVMGNLQ